MDNEVAVQKITLRAARINHQLSSQTVADNLGISAGTLEKYERDSRKIPFDDAMKLFRLYGISSVNVVIGIEDFE